MGNKQSSATDTSSKVFDYQTAANQSHRRQANQRELQPRQGQTAATAKQHNQREEDQRDFIVSNASRIGEFFLQSGSPRLVLHYCQMDEEDVRKICHPAVKQLELSSVWGTLAALAIFPRVIAKHRWLKELYLINVDAKASSVTPLLVCIPCFPNSLRTLYLHETNFNEKMWIMLARNLRSNNTLEVLDSGFIRPRSARNSFLIMSEVHKLKKFSLPYLTFEIPVALLCLGRGIQKGIVENELRLEHLHFLVQDHYLTYPAGKYYLSLAEKAKTMKVINDGWSEMKACNEEAVKFWKTTLRLSLPNGFFGW